MSIDMRDDLERSKQAMRDAYRAMVRYGVSLNLAELEDALSDLGAAKTRLENYIDQARDDRRSRRAA